MTEVQMGKLAGALAKAQGKITHAAKDGLNPAFKQSNTQGSRYATLASVWEACRAALSENEIAVTQAPLMVDGMLMMRTRLMHSSGEFEDAFCPIPVPVTARAQELGSAITYIRRYSLAAMVGVAPDDDDDDGNTAQEAGGQKTAKAAAKPASKPIEPILPPVDPATGKATPHLIPLGLVGDKMNYGGWGASYAAAIQQATTLEELELWVHANMVTMGQAIAKAVPVHARLTEILSERRAHFAAKTAAGDGTTKTAS